MKLAVTATQDGLTEEQFHAAYELLAGYCREISEFHHGGCVGGDDRLQWIVSLLRADQAPDVRIIMHRGNTPTKWALGCDENADEIILPKDNIERNHDMVHECDELLACPGSMYEVIRSGTWATMRYAHKQKKLVTIIYPDGTIGYW